MKHSAEHNTMQIHIPWNTITARSNVFALIVTGLLVYLLTFFDVSIYTRKQEVKTIPIELLQFGAGNDATKPSGGNLAQEGSARKGTPTKNPLEDAKASATMKVVTPVKTVYTAGANPTPVKELATKTPTRTEPTPVETGAVDIGRLDASNKGTGLGNYGSGKGSGDGYGLSFGVGGNRSVLYKELPQYPNGVNTNVQIKLKFVVQPNGAVGTIIAMQRGEPALERAATNALRKWKFNPIAKNEEMEGYITFTFKVH
jgi:TonB family protein